METDSLASIRSQLANLTAVVGRLNERVASLDTGAEAATRRKVLEHDLKLARLERSMVAAEPYSD